MTIDHREAGACPPFPGEQQQERPGLTSLMTPAPDHGETSYVGKGLLTDRVALITGGDSGIGRAVAIAYAREGADVAISYLPVEQSDAEETARWVEKAGRRVLLLPGDLREENHCHELVARTVAELGRIDILSNAAAQTITPCSAAGISASVSLIASGSVTTVETERGGLLLQMAHRANKHGEAGTGGLPDVRGGILDLGDQPLDVGGSLWCDEAVRCQMAA